MATTQLSQISDAEIAPNQGFFPTVENVYVNTASYHDEVFNRIFGQDKDSLSDSDLEAWRFEVKMKMIDAINTLKKMAKYAISETDNFNVKIEAAGVFGGLREIEKQIEEFAASLDEDITERLFIEFC